MWNVFWLRCSRRLLLPNKHKKRFTTEAQRTQSFTLLTAPAALLTIQDFSLCPLCLCGKSFLSFLLPDCERSAFLDDLKMFEEVHAQQYFFSGHIGKNGGV
ncbi:MAG: hypothetical protein BMS9Abin19_0039 [Gammaproteobacteria bacterium]|nr:MAG: hypothetical protein BMS9Abin19_0039 [Gammaproteobacteria bacterium]